MRILWTVLIILAVMWGVETLASLTGIHLVDMLVPRIRSGNGAAANAPQNAPGRVAS